MFETDKTVNLRS